MNQPVAPGRIENKTGREFTDKLNRSKIMDNTLTGTKD